MSDARPTLIQPMQGPPKRREKRIVNLGIGAAFAILLGVILFPCLESEYCRHQWLRGRALRQHQLLYETDHYAILAACRKMMKNRPGQPRDFYSGDYHRWIGERTATHPPTYEDFYSGNDPRLPPLIRQLDAHSVEVRRDHVHIEMGGGELASYGLTAWAADVVPKGHFADEMRVKVLLPGLWYQCWQTRQR